MKVKYRSIIRDVDDEIYAAERQCRVIDYIELTNDEWDGFIGELSSFLVSNTPLASEGPIKYLGVEIRKAGE